MKTDRQIILSSKIQDLERQLHNHTMSFSRAKASGNTQKMDFEKICIDDCKDRIEKAKGELQGI